MDHLRRLVRGRRSRLLGVAAGCVLIVVVLVADVLEGPRPAYVGVLTAAPLLAAIFARPRDVLVVGVLALLAGQGYALTVGAATAHPQIVRLGFITVGTLVAMLAAALREIRDEQLRELTDVAEAAQAAILTPVPRMAGSLAFAARYRSAASAAQVGGDFYDVANTEQGVRILLGDVRGKGLSAVRLAAVVLGSFREAAFNADADLPRVARTVSDAAARHGGIEDFVTAVFVELDVYGRGRIVRCGHPLPLRVNASGAAEVDPGVEQPPLGLVTDPVSGPLVLAPGERLLLYTDGLTEARDRSGAFLDVAAATQDLCSGSLEEALDRLLARVDQHTGSRLGDDLALLLVEHQVLESPPRDRSVERPGAVRD